MTWLKLIFAALPLLALAYAPPAAAAPPSKLALVIGNATYPALPALPTCTASARVVSAALRRAGFGVTEKLDPSNGEMGAAIGALAAALAQAPGSSAVLYVCGYTLRFEDRDFLLPASAVIDRDTDALTQGLAAKSVFDAVAGSGVAAGLVLLDGVVTPAHEPGAAFATLAQPPSASTGFAGVMSAAPPPQGATALAAAFSAAFAPPSIEAGTVLRAIAAHLGSGEALKVSAPTGMAWLAGAPIPRPPVVAPVASPAPSATPAPAPAGVPDEAHMTDADRQRVQAALLRLGYYDKQVDGVFGPDTRAAIRRFQHEIGAAMTGAITPAQSAILFSKAK